MKLLIQQFFIIYLVSSCTVNKNRNQSDETVQSATDSVERKVDDREPAELSDAYAENGDSITVPEFEIEIVLSDDAEQKINQQNETIIVQAYLTGIPKDDVSPELVDELGELALASPQVELIKPGVARFEGVTISRNSYESLTDKDFRVLINVFSGRRSSEFNILDCDILEEPISKVKGKRHKLNGRLIVE